MMKTALKGMRSVPKVQKNDPINAILVSFVMEIMLSKLRPLMLSDHSIIILRLLLFLHWPIKAFVYST